MDQVTEPTNLFNIFRYTSFKVRLGEWILNAATEPLPYIEVAVTSIKIHEGYTFTQATNTLLNDIA